MMSLGLTVFTAALGSISALVYLCFFIAGLGKYDDIRDAAPGVILFPGIIFPGCAMLAGLSRLPFEDSVRVRELFGAVSGRENATFIYYCFISSGASVSGLTLPAGLLAAALFRKTELIPLVSILPVIPWLYMLVGIKNKIVERNSEILTELPCAISKLTLLISAGILLRDAWEMTSKSSNGPLYNAMKEATDKMKNGMPEEDAFFYFSERTGIKEARQLASVLTQNLKKGGNGLAVSLRILNGEVWAEKKQRAVIEGKKAESKLLIPLMIMFIGILIMIMVPLLTGIA